ncbi:hypothetical protein BSL78_01779 [Apostichopus japonicus]|uniref:Uncharacterized protein n=1 Tax=Stichopus japonicus TaxID=307972 RepID=A0A2G8LLZ7_STIJA|nr:hypothetical protein BSL78_01779 [Apostichopus japonicus]
MPKLLEKRPEPPDLKEILEDLTNSEPDDVAFNFFTVNAKSSQVLEVAHFSGVAATGKQSDLGSSSRPRGEENKKPQDQLSEVDKCYERVTDLIESYNYLKNSQTTLSESCNELEVMGQKVQEQISELKDHLSHR